MILGLHGNHRGAPPRTVKLRFELGRELYDAVLAGVERIIPCADHVRARKIPRAALADDDLAHPDVLSVLELHPEPLRYGVAAELC